MYSLSHHLVQKSYLMGHRKRIGYLLSRENLRVLDIGSGYGFVKKLVEEKNCSYLGIEPDLVSYEASKSLYGNDFYINGYFPDCLRNDKELFDVIIVLTCIDEVTDRDGFLSALSEKMTQHAQVLIVVRNSYFFVNSFKRGFVKRLISERGEFSLNDWSYDEWKLKFIHCGFDIFDERKYFRPLFIGLSFVGFKNILYNLCTFILPRRLAYMNEFLLKKRH